MTPVFALNNQINSGSMHPIFSAHCRQFTIFASVVFLYFFNLFYGQNMILMLLAKKMRGLATSITSVFSNTIQTIIFRCSHKQMARSYARGVVASVANQKPFWNGAVLHSPRKSMGFNGGPHLAFIDSDLTIAAPISTCGPFPTAFTFSNIFPKVFHNRDVLQIQRPV